MSIVHVVLRLNHDVQAYARPSVIEALFDEVMTVPVLVVFDHFAAASARLGVEQEGFGALLKLLGAGGAYVKLSAAYRSSDDAPDYRDAEPLARALIAAKPETASPNVRLRC